MPLGFMEREKQESASLMFTAAKFALQDESEYHDVGDRDKSVGDIANDMKTICCTSPAASCMTLAAFHRVLDSPFRT